MIIETRLFLVSGVILAEVWFNSGIPVVEYREKDLYDKILTGRYG